MLTYVDLKHLDIQYDLGQHISLSEWNIVELTIYGPLADVQWNGIRRLIFGTI